MDLPSYRQLAARTLGQAADLLNRMPQGDVSCDQVIACSAQAQTIASLAAAQALLEIGDVLRRLTPSPPTRAIMKKGGGLGTVPDVQVSTAEAEATPEPNEGGQGQPEEPPEPTEEARLRDRLYTAERALSRIREALAMDDPRTTAEAALARVRALHHSKPGPCRECAGEISAPWPCSTIRAINGSIDEETQ
ncbi:hypothetical protein ABZ419_11600 [Streptomyces cinnamoneus]|uniref:hypothetical protein n=1 Tax=Streptomyces cinnamoneus TaxID=53446 RepID=UPI0033DBF1E0